MADNNENIQNTQNVQSTQTVQAAQPAQAAVQPAPKKKTGWIIGLLVAICILLLLIIIGAAAYIGVTSYVKYQQSKKPQLTSAYITSKLEDCSDLTTAEITYTGLVHYDDGGIPFLTQKKYSMIYSATIEAGIDMSGVEVEVTDDKVTVTLPEVEVDDPQVDLDSIDFYDESFAIFNWDEKEDGIDAMKVAREDCKEKADISGLKGRAYENAKKIVSELLEDLIGDRELEVK